MGTKILIVEDQFIEANDLKITLERAGHQVTGIAKSYDQAISLMEKERPEIVLLDIYLKGKLTGLDLAAVLSKESIPFIYLSANSNASVLDSAKATRPHGFLVKPFREKDLLVALDVASYRHNYTVELVYKQERLLSSILCSIVSEEGNAVQKLLMVMKAFRPFIPFDFAHIDIDINNDDLNSIYCFRRIAYNDYEFDTGPQTMVKYKLSNEFYNNYQRNIFFSSVVKIENQQEFVESASKIPFLKALKEAYQVNARLIVPLLQENKVTMCIRFYSFDPQGYNSDHLELINPLRGLLTMVIDNIKRENNYTNSSPAQPRPVKATSDNDGPQIEGIVGNSPKLLHALDQVTQVANFDMTVLILGETGVGKEGLVNAIHRMSGRSRKPLVKINCAAIPAALIESELFGHEKGSFTGAFERRIGKFEQANGGTIFLDEIGEIPLETQTKLLRVLQEKEIERIGGRNTIKIDVRVVAATNRNLHQDVATGKFRMDLYYRINVFPITLAPLRERIEDIPLLVNYFLSRHSNRTAASVKQVSPAVLQKLMAYSWPGNIRELVHVVERSKVLTIGNTITSVDLPDDMLTLENNFDPLEKFRSIADVDRAHIIAALKKCNGRVSGKGGAAEILNMPATTLNSKMKKLGISGKFIF